jgi:hypothetical protein
MPPQCTARHNYCSPYVRLAAGRQNPVFRCCFKSRFCFKQCLVNRGIAMATSRKGSTTPKDLKDDAGGLVAGGGPDLSGTAIPPAKPASSKTRAKPIEGAAKPDSSKGAGDKPPARSRSKAASATPKEATRSNATGSPTDGGDADRSASTQPMDDAARSSTSGDAAGAGAGSTRMSDEERQRRIAEAAYRKAQERGFAGDRQLDDWLDAEREHNQTQGGPH